MAAAFATAQPMRRLLVFISMAEASGEDVMTHLPFAILNDQYLAAWGGGPHEFGRFVPLDKLMEINFLGSSGATVLGVNTVVTD